MSETVEKKDCPCPCPPCPKEAEHVAPEPRVQRLGARDPGGSPVPRPRERLRGRVIEEDSASSIAPAFEAVTREHELFLLPGALGLPGELVLGEGVARWNAPQSKFSSAFAAGAGAGTPQGPTYTAPTVDIRPKTIGDASKKGVGDPHFKKQRLSEEQKRKVETESKIAPAPRLKQPELKPGGKAAVAAAQAGKRQFGGPTSRTQYTAQDASKKTQELAAKAGLVPEFGSGPGGEDALPGQPSQHALQRPIDVGAQKGAEAAVMSAKQTRERIEPPSKSKGQEQRRLEQRQKSIEAKLRGQPDASANAAPGAGSRLGVDAAAPAGASSGRQGVSTAVDSGASGYAAAVPRLTAHVSAESAQPQMVTALPPTAPRPAPRTSVPIPTTAERNRAKLLELLGRSRPGMLGSPEASRPNLPHTLELSEPVPRPPTLPPGRRGLGGGEDVGRAVAAAAPPRTGAVTATPGALVSQAEYLGTPVSIVPSSPPKQPTPPASSTLDQYAPFAMGADPFDTGVARVQAVRRPGRPAAKAASDAAYWVGMALATEGAHALDWSDSDAWTSGFGKDAVDIAAAFAADLAIQIRNAGLEGKQAERYRQARTNSAIMSASVSIRREMLAQWEKGGKKPPKPSRKDALDVAKMLFEKGDEQHLRRAPKDTEPPPPGGGPSPDPADDGDPGADGDEATGADPDCPCPCPCPPTRDGTTSDDWGKEEEDDDDGGGGDAGGAGKGGYRGASGEIIEGDGLGGIEGAGTGGAGDHAGQESATDPDRNEADDPEGGDEPEVSDEPKTWSQTAQMARLARKRRAWVRADWRRLERLLRRRGVRMDGKEWRRFKEQNKRYLYQKYNILMGVANATKHWMAATRNVKPLYEYKILEGSMAARLMDFSIFNAAGAASLRDAIELTHTAKALDDLHFARYDTESNWLKQLSLDPTISDMIRCADPTITSERELDWWSLAPLVEGARTVSRVWDVLSDSERGFLREEGYDTPAGRAEVDEAAALLRDARPGLGDRAMDTVEEFVEGKSQGEIALWAAGMVVISLATLGVGMGVASALGTAKVGVTLAAAGGGLVAGGVGTAAESLWSQYTLEGRTMTGTNGFRLGEVFEDAVVGSAFGALGGPFADELRLSASVGVRNAGRKLAEDVANDAARLSGRVLGRGGVSGRVGMTETVESVAQSEGRAGRGLLGLFGEPVPPPSGAASRSLKAQFLRSSRDPAFRARADAWASRLGRDPIDWRALTTRLRSAEFREFASFNEARRSLGYAGAGPGGEWLFGVPKSLRGVPFVGDSVVRHELAHAIQDMQTALFAREAAAATGWAKFSVVAPAEIGAATWGGPLSTVTIGGGLVAGGTAAGVGAGYGIASLLEDDE